jgi:phosphotransferase system HPr (HPr) family protein
MSDAKLMRTVAVANEGGLHVRAAHLIAKLVREFDCRVVLIKDHQRAEGTEVLQILSLTALPGDELQLEASGPDAAKALDAIEQLFADKFHDDEEQEPREAENRP